MRLQNNTERVVNEPHKVIFAFVNLVNISQIKFNKGQRFLAEREETLDTLVIEEAEEIQRLCGYEHEALQEDRALEGAAEWIQNHLAIIYIVLNIQSISTDYLILLLQILILVEVFVNKGVSFVQNQGTFDLNGLLLFLVFLLQLSLLFGLLDVVSGGLFSLKSEW